MPRKKSLIPVNSFAQGDGIGINVARISSVDLPVMEAQHAHRHDHHIFVFLQKGSGFMEIDFQNYRLSAPILLYVHPDQVHRIIEINKVEGFIAVMSAEQLDPGYLSLLEQELSPSKPLQLEQEMRNLLDEAAGVCLTISKRSDSLIYHSLLKHACNTFVGLVISRYQDWHKSVSNSSRYEIVNKAFKTLLALHFLRLKRPSDYARLLNISGSYLNECVSEVTGRSVSFQIQERVVLEAKRLLYYSDKSVKEIANELGYADYAYFSRMFRKLSGVSATAFRSKNRE